MRRMSIGKGAVAMAAALMVSVWSGPAKADQEFQTLQGVPAEALSRSGMAEVQGKLIDLGFLNIGSDGLLGLELLGGKNKNQKGAIGAAIGGNNNKSKGLIGLGLLGDNDKSKGLLGAGLLGTNNKSKGAIGLGLLGTNDKSKGLLGVGL